MVVHRRGLVLVCAGEMFRFEPTSPWGWPTLANHSVLLPIAVRVRLVIPSELIAFAINNENHAN
jgi:hypothetical protein